MSRVYLQGWRILVLLPVLVDGPDSSQILPVKQNRQALSERIHFCFHTVLPPEELHGSVYRNHCMRCGKSFDFAHMKHSTGVPRCECGGMIKPDVVLYEEGLDTNTIEESVRAISNAQILIIGGTSLAVYPAAGLIDYYRGSKLVLINKSVTSRDSQADLVISDSIGKVLGAVVE